MFLHHRDFLEAPFRFKQVREFSTPLVTFKTKIQRGTEVEQGNHGE